MAIKEVQKQLRSWNYRMRNVSKLLKCTLLIGGKVRLIVELADPGKETIIRHAKECDVMAVVGGEKILYAAGEDDVPELGCEGYRKFENWKKSPAEVIPK